MDTTTDTLISAYDHYLTLEGAEDRADYYSACVMLMDDDIREQLAMDIAPCTDMGFLRSYCIWHAMVFDCEFVVN